MEVYRLDRKIYSASLSGIGAAKKGARWNSIGVEMIYAAENRSLAMAEVAVHLTLATLPPDFIIMTIFIPNDISQFFLNVSSLPINWNSNPHDISTQKIGDKFILDNI